MSSNIDDNKGMNNNKNNKTANNSDINDNTRKCAFIVLTKAKSVKKYLIHNIR
jgi:hypothetical protein